MSDAILLYSEEIIHTASGYAITRSDGATAEFLDREDAEECLAALIAGDMRDSDLEWRDRGLGPR